MSDKQRAEFEKWVKPWGWCTDVDSDGFYEETPVQMAWNAWCAATASVVVELPRPSSAVDYGYELNDIQNTLTDAGIRYE